MVELSVVLVVMAVIVGAVATASDLMRQASGQRIFTEFISNWKSAYISFTTRKGRVPADDSIPPKGKIKGSVGSELCNSELISIMLHENIELPTGHGPGEESKYVYQDGNGSPHTLEICLVTVEWAVPDVVPDRYVKANRHVIHFKGMTIELALQIDALVDGISDQRFGKFRSLKWAAANDWGKPKEWPNVKAQAGEEKIDEIETYLLLN